MKELLPPKLHWTRQLKNTLLTGLFVIGPLSLTVMLFGWIVSILDSALAPLVGLFGRPLPGLGLVTAFLLILGAGVLANNIVGRHLLEFGEDLLLKVPVFSWLYKTIKQVSDVFSPSAKTQFKSVVIIEYPRNGVFMMGFVTNYLELDRGDRKETLLSVYVPTNHIYVGDYILVPEEKVIHTVLTHQQGIQSTISAGASLPKVIKVLPNKKKPAV